MISRKNGTSENPGVPGNSDSHYIMENGAWEKLGSIWKFQDYILSGKNGTSEKSKGNRKFWILREEQGIAKIRKYPENQQNS